MNASAGVLYAPNFRPSVMARSGAATSATGRALAALSFAYCAAGTMGVVTPEALEQRAATSNSPIHYESAPANPVLVVEPVTLEPSPAEDLARVREVLKPAVLELANLFGVSRQAVYAWQDGAQPAPVAAARLAMLARAADVFAKAGVAADTKTLRRKVAGGGTVLDAVLTGGDAVQVAESLVQTLAREAAQRQRLNQQLAGRQRPPADPDEYGSPASAEDA
jgi:hypothetical protein